MPLDWARDVNEAVGLSPISMDMESTVQVNKAMAESLVVPTLSITYGPRDLSALCSGTGNPWGSLSHRHHRHHRFQSPRDPSTPNSTKRTTWNSAHHPYQRFYPLHPPSPCFDPLPNPTPIYVIKTVRHPQGIAPTKPVVRTTSPVHHNAPRAPVRPISASHFSQMVTPPNGHPSRPPLLAIHPAFAAQCHCGAIRWVRQEFGPSWGAPGFGEKFPRSPRRHFRRSM